MAHHTTYHTDEESKYRCCCNKMHVEKGAYVIAIVGIVVSAIAAIAHFFTLNWLMFAVNLIALVCFIFIIFAQKRHNPNLYLPFLIIVGICLLLALINLILMIIAIFVRPAFYTDSIRHFYAEDEDNHRGGRTAQQQQRDDASIYFVLAVSILLAGIVFGLYAWFYSVVYRAYQYMKEVQRVKVTSVPVGGGGGGGRSVIQPHNQHPQPTAGNYQYQQSSKLATVNVQELQPQV